MPLLVVGLSYRTAPVELREAVDFARLGLDRALTTLAGQSLASEAVVLSTCNRAEVYAVTAGGADAEALGRFISSYHRLDHADISEHLYCHAGADAARHLFRVAAGLDSLVVGEPQILGQVKSAFTAAANQRHTGPLLNRLFHSAFGVGKRVRSETGLASGAVSVSYAAIALARKIFSDLKGLSVLILGAGEMAKLTGVHLQAQEVRQITIASRTLATSESLARRLGGQAVPWEQLDAALGAADIVIAATGATDPVLTRARIDEAMRPRQDRPVFIIDIALPRDVEAAVGDLNQVFLYNIDDLQGIVRENLARRSSELTRAEAIVSEELGRFTTWMQSRGVVPTVVALRQRFDTIRRAELERLEPKLAGLTPEARARVEEVTRLIVEKLLLTPTEQLKGAADPAALNAYAEALTQLFDLSERPAPAPEPQLSKAGPK